MSIICKTCGKELADTAKFCNGCGAAVEEAPAADFEMNAQDLYRQPDGVNPDAGPVANPTEENPAPINASAYVDPEVKAAAPDNKAAAPATKTAAPAAKDPQKADAPKTDPPKASAKPRRFRPNAGQVIGSVLLTIVASILLLVFMVLTLAKNIVSEKTLDTVLNNLDSSDISFSEIKVGNLSDFFGDVVDEDDTLSEAIYAINDDLFDELGVTERDIEKLLDSETIKESITAKISEGMDTVLSGEGYTLTSDDIVDLLEENKDEIEDTIHVELTDKDYEIIKDKMAESGMSEITFGINGLTAGSNDTEDENASGTKARSRAIGQRSVVRDEAPAASEDSTENVTTLQKAAEILSSEVTRYVILGLALLLYVLILVINRNVIYAGFRADGISAIIVGLVGTAGVLVGTAFIGSLTTMFGIPSEIIAAVKSALTGSCMVVTLPILGTGVLFLLISIIVQAAAFNPKKH